MKYILFILILTGCMCSVEKQIEVKSTDKKIPTLAVNTPEPIQRFIPGECFRYVGNDPWDAYTFKVKRTGKYSYLVTYIPDVCIERDSETGECLETNRGISSAEKSISFDNQTEYEKVSCEE